MTRGNRFIYPALISGIALVIGLFFIANAINKFSKKDQIITVTGSAKKDLVSDLGIQRGNLSISGGTAAEAYRLLQNQKPILLDYLKTKGFSVDQIEFQTISNYPNYNYGENGVQLGIRDFTCSQGFEFQSNDVKKIKDISLDISSLVERGLNFSVSSPEYYYTKLADLKIEIQAAAAKDAMTRGQKIAEATSRKLGTLTNARMGVLQITPKNSNMISDYGMNDVSSIEKELTAVVNASFEIE